MAEREDPIGRMLGRRVQVLAAPDAILDAHRVLRGCLGERAVPRPLNPAGEGDELHYVPELGLWHREAETTDDWLLSVGAVAPGTDDPPGAWLALAIRKDGFYTNDAAFVRLGPEAPLLLVHGGGFNGGLGDLFFDYFRGLQLNVWDEEAPTPGRMAVIGVVDEGIGAALHSFCVEVERLRAQVESGRIVAPAATSFFDEPEETQVELLWEILLGQGALKVEEAVRFAAPELRKRGMVRYERLRKGGEVYETLASLLHEAAATEDLFDRPKRGAVRAVERDANAFSGEMWRDCLLTVLTSEPVERQDAIRAAADAAVEYYGLDHQRLRSGGRVERGLKSAINSAVRRGLVERATGAAIRLAPRRRGATEEPAHAPPEVEGAGAEAAVLERDASDDRATPVLTPPDVATTQEPPAKVGSVAPISTRITLDASVDSLPFPTRTLNWADRVEVRTLRDLVAWHPDAFVREKNIGRGSVRRTRELIEDAFGADWEVLWRDIDGTRVEPAASDSSEDEEEPQSLSPRGVSWDETLSTLSPEVRDAPLAEVDLPARMESYVEREGLRTVGELLARPASALIAEPNLGRGSLRETLNAVRRYSDELHVDVLGSSFMGSLRDQLRSLDPVLRLVVSRRCGLSGEPETLQVLGETLGVTRERARQLEVKTTERLRKKRWTHRLRERIVDALGPESSTTLDVLSQDPWWAGVADHLDVLDYVLTRVLDADVHVVRFDDLGLLSRAPADDLEAAWRDIRTRTAALTYPVPYETVVNGVAEGTSSLGPAVQKVFSQRLEEYLHFGEEGDRRWVVAFGKNKRAEVLAILQARDKPIRVSDLYDRVGRCHLPDDVLFFSRGVVGLEKHFPEFGEWRERLVPECISIMEGGAPGRQWGVSDLHEELVELLDIPDWLGTWHLASLLRTSGRVDYLGRLRVQLPSEEGDGARIHIADHVHDVLDEAGEPLAEAAIAAKVREATDVRDSTLRLLLLRSPFVRVDADRFGLLERDVPGGSAAIAQAVDRALAILDEQVRPAASEDVLATLAASSSIHGQWHVETLKSVLRNEPRIRLSRKGEVALAAWDDEVEEAVAESELPPAPEPVAPVLTLAAPRPAQTLLVEMDPLADAARARLLARMPNDARPYFRRLLDEPPLSNGELLSQVDGHVRAFEHEMRTNEFVDLPLARKLAVQSKVLLALQNLSPDQRRVAQAAVRYFVISDDADDDFGIGGLDDDDEVMTVVLEYLGVGA